MMCGTRRAGRLVWDALLDGRVMLITFSRSTGAMRNTLRGTIATGGECDPPGDTGHESGARRDAQNSAGETCDAGNV